VIEGRIVSDVTEITSDDWQGNTLGMTMCGGSGAGKTTMARCLMDQWSGSTAILFDLDHEPDMGRVVESVDELKQAILEGEDRIAIRPPVTVVDEPELFEETVQFLLSLGNALRAQEEGKILFLMDEAQDLQEQWLLVALKRMRKRRIKPVALTQDPVSLPKRARTVADYNAWLSPPPSDMKETVEQLGYPLELLEELPAYDMLILGENWEPEARYRAPERYAR